MNNKWLTIGIEEISDILWNNPQNQHDNKPFGGLWASPYIEHGQYKSAWDKWCTYEMPNRVKNYGVLFELKEDSKIYTIDSADDLKELLSKYENKQSLLYGTITSFAIIDFEALAKDYDGVFLTNKGQCDTRFSQPSLYGWDVESLVLLNKDCILHWERIEW